MATNPESREAADSPGGGAPKRRIGPYELDALLGVGGMGEVYKAIRVDDFHQVAAIKLLAQGLNDREVLSRFHAEQQVLASLHHPNIVRLLDAGSTAEGVPYIVMEYVEGTPLDEYCAAHRLDLAARIRLMIQALGAVDYAHQRFLVHCDLKFSNILVTADGTAKLLDFGITKLLSPEQYGIGESLTQSFRPMTLGFASPEQLLGQKLSTASDIYSCGVILFGLMTGQHPFEDQIKNPVGFIQTLQSADAEAPGSRARRIGNSLVPAEAIDKDLDAIAQRALRSAPEHRYRSAERFAADLKSYLAGRPVEAREGSLGYRTAKFIRRNRFTAVGVAALAGALAFGVAGKPLRSGSRARIRRAFAIAGEEGFRTRVEGSRTFAAGRKKPVAPGGLGRLGTPSAGETGRHAARSSRAVDDVDERLMVSGPSYFVFCPSNVFSRSIRLRRSFAGSPGFVGGINESALAITARASEGWARSR